MSINKLPPYVFRGTTIGYPGNKTSVDNSFCCTSKNPVKALWFAMECMIHNERNNAVVYIADTSKLRIIPITQNVLNKLEEEIAFNITPVEFYSYCIGYIEVSDFQKALLKLNVEPEPYRSVRIEYLSRLCQETPIIPVKTIKSFVSGIFPIIKKS